MRASKKLTDLERSALNDAYARMLARCGQYIREEEDEEVNRLWCATFAGMTVLWCEELNIPVPTDEQLRTEVKRIQDFDAHVREMQARRKRHRPDNAQNQ